MAKQIIAATISVETGSANASVKEFNKNVNQADASLNDLKSSAGGAGKSIEGAGGSFGKLKSSIGTLPGALGSAQSGVAGLNAGFKALLANPIGIVLAAIVGLLYTLYKAFTNTFEGANKVEEVFAGIKATAQALFDNLGKVASAIKNVFTFNFSGAIDDIKEVANAAGEAYNKMASLTRQAQQLKQEQLANDLDGAERAKKLAVLREQATDETIPIKKRIELGKQLLAEAEQNSKDDIDLAKRTAENKIAQLTLEKDGAKKNQEEITKIRIEQINNETENLGEVRRIRKQVNAAEKQEENEKKALAKEAADRQKESNEKYKHHLKEQLELAKKQAKQQEDLRKAQREGHIQEIKDIEDYGAALIKEQNRIDKAEEERIANNEKTRLQNKKKNAELNALDNPDSSQSKIALVQANLDIENSLLDANDLQRQVNAKKASDAIIKIKKDEVDADLALEQAKVEGRNKLIQEIANGLGNLSYLVGKQTVAGKAFAIAQTTIDTYQGATAAYKSLAGIPVVGPVLGAIAAAAAIKNGIETVKKITAVQIPGGGGGSGSGPSGSLSAPAAPLAPQQQSTRLDAGSINAVGNATTRPMQAYVVEGQGADARARAERLNRAAKLGG